MAVLHISEYSELDGVIDNVALEPPVAQQTVTIGAEADSAALNTATRFVRLHAGAACHRLVGAAPTATTSHTPMAAGQTEYIAVTPGHKISVIAAA